MKKTAFFLTVFSALFFLMCDFSTNNNNNNGNGDTTITDTTSDTTLSIVVGLWKDTLPPLEFFNQQVTKYPFYINFDIKKDSTYKVTVIEDRTDTTRYMFYSVGTWTEDADSIYLTADTTQALDTATNTLVDQPDLCGYPIGVEKNISTNATTGQIQWSMTLASFGPLLDALPLSETAKKAAQAVPIVLNKEE